MRLPDVVSRCPALVPGHLEAAVRTPSLPFGQERQGTDSCWALPRAQCAGRAHPPLMARWTRAGGQQRRFI